MQRLFCFFLIPSLLICLSPKSLTDKRIVTEFSWLVFLFSYFYLRKIIRHLHKSRNHYSYHSEPNLHVDVSSWGRLACYP